MLINIDQNLSPDILKTLREMGHGDKVLISDINFPAHSNNNKIHRLDGLDMPTVMRSILSVFPLDSFVLSPIHRMEVDNAPDEINEVNKEVIDVIKEVSGDYWTVGSIERQQFYQETKKVYAVITTSERRPYCNFILTKGVLKPDGSVWLQEK